MFVSTTKHSLITLLEITVIPEEMPRRAELQSELLKGVRQSDKHLVEFLSENVVILDRGNKILDIHFLIVRTITMHTVSHEIIFVFRIRFSPGWDYWNLDFESTKLECI